jgi:hypothetical protein
MDKQVVSTECELDDLGCGLDDLDNATTAASAAEACRQRFALVCDATGSMSSTWRAAQDALKQSVDQIKSRATVPIQIQVVAYRDVDDGPDAVCEHSEWSDDTNYLQEFIKSVRCFGGGDYPESIGQGLRHLLQQQVKSVILIGDAPGKQPDTGFEEATIMGRDQCPIYALYTNEHDSRLRSHFEKLAKLSGGKAMHLGNFKDLKDILSVLLTSNKALQVSYQPETESGKRARALLGA